MYFKKCPLYVFILILKFTLTLPHDLMGILRKQNNLFTGKMLVAQLQEKPGVNVVTSGFSVLTPLSLLTIASEGPTHKELIMGTGLMNDNIILAIFSLLKEKFKVLDSIQFNAANKIFINQNYELNDNFDAISRDVFATQVQNVDFTDDRTTYDINSWVAAETNNRIRRLILPGSLNNVNLLLVNLLHFKGKWKLPFAKLHTKSKPFYINNQKSVLVPTMHNQAGYMYTESRTLNAKILKMDYVGNQASLVIVLPNEVEGIGKLIENLKDLNVLDDELKKMTDEEVILALPKFTVETSVDLVKILQKLNIIKVFNEEADLNKLLKSHEKIFVNKAIQKAFIEVDEAGTEAGVANVITIAGSSLDSPKREKHFIADHPFAYYLKILDFTLFSGVYNGGL